ncbi:MAG: protein jag [Pyrinomonadaceae bacterium]
MNEVCMQGREFLNAVFGGAKLDLHAELKETPGGCLINIDGADDSFLLGEGGELLEAIEHLVNQAHGRSLARDERIVCDAKNFRATREAELRAMAQYAAEQVRKNGVAFIFAPMIANERRLIHLSLAEESDLTTESVGEGAARRLKVSLKTPAGL